MKPRLASARSPAKWTRGEPGAVMWLPPYERHQIKNTGASTMKFICCVPR
jgi:oxalate decarboxylase/phosphoglucose isomerase-like protein (cupin superfamily)